jgi:hypothetical protein
LLSTHQWCSGPRLDFWEERTHCHKVRRIEHRLEQHRAIISNEWAQLQGFNDVMTKIDRLVKSGQVVQAITVKQPSYEGQRTCAPRHQAGHMTAADQTVQREKSACHEAVHICLMGADVGQVL